MSYLKSNPGEKLWTVRADCSEGTPEEIKKLSEELEVTPAFARLLAFRGYKNPAAARSFLCVEDEVLHDPFLLTDMDRAVGLLESALAERKKIMIYGDYDVDGVTSISVLELYLRSRGADVSYYIPDRLGEGYGMSYAAIARMAQEGVGLIVTVDTGITANTEIALAKQSGMCVIVTDHHECHGELPCADAVVNPHRPGSAYPFSGLAGVGVVFKLVCAAEMQRSADRADAVRRVCAEYADLVALGTVADVMPLVDENRLIVKYGLRRIQSGSRMAISALIAASQYRPGTAHAARAPRINSSFIGYTLAPRINAAGRITNASVAAELFLTDSRERADALAAELCETNRFRQSEENKIAEEAYARIEAEHDFERDPVIVLDDDGWHHGVIGIVASRITEKYGLPSILVSYEGRAKGEPPLGTDLGKGSGRSIKGLNLVDALVYCGDLLEKYGGHQLAAGLSVRRANIGRFRERINEYAREILKDAEQLQGTLDYDLELSPEDIDLSFAEELRLLEPCGIGNATPYFVLRDVPVCDVIPVGAGKHSRMIVKCGGRETTAMVFSRAPAAIPVFGGERADLLFSLDINEFNGNRTVQMICRDVRHSEKELAEHEAEKRRFAELREGARMTAGEDVVPGRADITAVYTLLRRESRIGNAEMSVRVMLALLAESGAKAINYMKLRFSLLILQELNVLSLEETEEEYYSFRVIPTPAKTDLERSGILRSLRSMQKQEQSNV
ncbi:MAG: single-stranded-DNA-specific exonuclease RecJ [Eubacteriales bacterium]|nr:single-stranded-DNA-specific exonuclease RecJ [Eubacteriales bacterium]